MFKRKKQRIFKTLFFFTNPCIHGYLDVSFMDTHEHRKILDETANSAFLEQSASTTPMWSLSCLIAHPPHVIISMPDRLTHPNSKVSQILPYIHVFFRLTLASQTPWSEILSSTSEVGPGNFLKIIYLQSDCLLNINCLQFPPSVLVKYNLFTVSNRSTG